MNVYRMNGPLNRIDNEEVFCEAIRFHDVNQSGRVQHTNTGNASGSYVFLIATVIRKIRHNQQITIPQVSNATRQVLEQGASADG